jgi:glutathione-regulated potassium-efflux system ancillary protein KefC
MTKNEGSLPLLTRAITGLYGRKTAAVRTKWLVLVLTGLGALALWAGSEAVLPAYIAGMVLARTLNHDPQFLRRFRTLTVGFLTPFYFLRTGSLVSLPALAGAPLVMLALLGTKLLLKTGALLPILGRFREVSRERWYTSLLMATGLTFGTIAAIYGLNHGIITRSQYSLIVASVIGSAVVPTIIAGRFFLPTHLLPEAAVAGLEDPESTGPAAGRSEDAGTE